MPGEGDERQERADGERRGRLQAGPATARREERHEPEEQEHLPDRTGVDERRDAQPQRAGASGGRKLDRARQQERDEREGGREERVARKLVEEQDVARVREQRRRRRERSGRPEATGDAEPRNDRERVQDARRRPRSRPGPRRGATR